MRSTRWHSLCRRNLKSRAIPRRGSKVYDWIQTFKMCWTEMCVCIYGQFKCTELADSSCFSSSSLLNAVQPLYWRSLRSKHPWAERVNSQPFCSSQVRPKAPVHAPEVWVQRHHCVWGMSLSLFHKLGSLSLATKSPTEIKRFCLCLERDGQKGQNSLLAHDSD